MLFHDQCTNEFIALTPLIVKEREESNSGITRIISGQFRISLHACLALVAKFSSQKSAASPGASDRLKRMGPIGIEQTDGKPLGRNDRDHD